MIFILSLRSLSAKESFAPKKKRIIDIQWKIESLLPALIVFVPAERHHRSAIIFICHKISFAIQLSVPNKEQPSTTMFTSSISRWVSTSNGSRALVQLSRRSFASTAAMTASFDKLGVIGLGLMGHGIAQTAAAAAAKDGIHSSIIAYESEDKFLNGGRDRIQMSVDKLVSKEKLSSADAGALMNKVSGWQ